MKFKIVFILLFLFSLKGVTQEPKVKNLVNYDKQPIHFGFSLGFNTMDFVIRPSQDFLDNSKIYSIENQKLLGFNLGPIVNFRMGNYFDFRSLILLSFGQRNLEYRVNPDSVDHDTPAPFSLKTMELESTFLEFPLSIKYKGKRLNNVRPYIIAGANPKFDLAARKKITKEEKPKIRLRQFDVYYEVGMGLDFYLQFFKFSTEIKFSQGLFNVMKPDNTAYTNTVDWMHSRMLMLSFHFE